MKKLFPNFGANTIYGLLATALIIGGITLMITVPTTTIILYGILFVSLGAILAVGVRTYNIFMQVLESLTNCLNILNNGLSPQNTKTQSSPQFITKEIKIDQNTSPEELEKIKSQLPPEISQHLEQIMGSMTHGIGNLQQHPFMFGKDMPIISMTNEQLKSELEKAVADNNFERAAEIRDEINKRK